LKNHWKNLLIVFLLAFCMAGCSKNFSQTAQNELAANQLGSKDNPLRVMLVPADGGTEQGTLADYEPIFNAITKTHGLHFTLRVGQSYRAVVESMVTAQVEIAFFGPVTFNQARQKKCVELLAVGVVNNESVYYAGIFVRKESNIKTIYDLIGRSVAFGDVNSTSSFNYPMAMLLDAEIDPIKDLTKIHLTGSHAYSLDALKTGKVDAACAAYLSFEKAVNNGALNPEEIRPLIKSDPIPYPPLAMHIDLDPQIKNTLRKAFNTIHKTDGVSPEMIRGYGGKKVDRYNADYPIEEFDKAMAKLARVTDDLKAAIIKKAASM
jgi:phosphonate transport system substrate-binding protein